MEWIQKNFVNIPNRTGRKRKNTTDSERNLDSERDEATDGYETLAKRMQYEKPSYITLTKRVAERVAKDIMYHETIMEHFMDQPAYKFIMNVASFTNDDVSKFWSDHIKTNKPTPYKLGDDVRDTAVAIARERADQDVHQWCKRIEITQSSTTSRKMDFDTVSSPSPPEKVETSETKNNSPSSTRGTGLPPSPSTSNNSNSPKYRKRSPFRIKTPRKEIEKLVERGYKLLFPQEEKIVQEEKEENILFEQIRNEQEFIKWMRGRYRDSIQNTEYGLSEITKLNAAVINDDVDDNDKKYYYDLEGLRFTLAPPLTKNEYKNEANVRFYHKDSDNEWCHKDPCGYEYIALVRFYYEKRFDFHLHDYLKNHYEEKMAYEIQKWYNNSPETIKKIFFAPVIYGHMNEVTFALTHRYPKFKDCNAEDFYSSPEHAVLFAKCVALAIRGSQVLSGKKYGLDKSFMRINLEKRRAMHAWKHLQKPKKAISSRNQVPDGW